MNILCTICARGGSKGVHNKNIRKLMNKPLIAYTIEQAQEIELIDRIVVSTDSDQIANIAKDYGAEVPFLRPKELAGDTAPKLPVIQHAVRYYKDEMDYDPSIVIDMDPTSPLRIKDDIKRCFDLILTDKNCDSVITGYRTNKNPYFNMVEENEKGYAHLSKEPLKPINRRQDAPIVYAMNASIYVWKKEILFNQKSIISGRVKIIEMPDDRSIDIDSEVDFKLVELLLNERSKK